MITIIVFDSLQSNSFAQCKAVRWRWHRTVPSEKCGDCATDTFSHAENQLNYKKKKLIKVAIDECVHSLLCELEKWVSVPKLSCLKVCIGRCCGFSLAHWKCSASPFRAKPRQACEPMIFGVHCRKTNRFRRNGAQSQRITMCCCKITVKKPVCDTEKVRCIRFGEVNESQTCCCYYSCSN